MHRSSALGSEYDLPDLTAQFKTLVTVFKDSKPWNLNSGGKKPYHLLLLFLLNTLKTTLKPHSAVMTLVLPFLPVPKNMQLTVSIALEFVCSHHTLFISMCLLFLSISSHLNLFPTMKFWSNILY